MCKANGDCNCGTTTDHTLPAKLILSILWSIFQLYFDSTAFQIQKNVNQLVVLSQYRFCQHGGDLRGRAQTANTGRSMRKNVYENNGKICKSVFYYIHGNGVRTSVPGVRVACVTPKFLRVSYSLISILQ